ncbi:MAG: class I SAM-dependent methyltransferase, partial [Chloroflexi bacterium]|nr:class I SAM-dependent methyltransferase [Chloroflexota bacterium]
IRTSHVFSALRHLSPNGRSILDAGCGRGSYAIRCALTYPKSEIVGCDLDDAAVKKAQARGDALGLQRLHFQRANLTTDLGEDRYDVILCVDVLEHIESVELALEAMHRALKPGGHLVVHVPATPQRRFLPWLRSWHQDDHVREGFDLPSFVTLLTASGLSVDSSKATFGWAGTLAWDVYQTLRSVARPKPVPVFAVDEPSGPGLDHVDLVLVVWLLRVFAPRRVHKQTHAAVGENRAGPERALGRDTVQRARYWPAIPPRDVRTVRHYSSDRRTSRTSRAYSRSTDSHSRSTAAYAARVSGCSSCCNRNSPSALKSVIIRIINNTFVLPVAGRDTLGFGAPRSSLMPISCLITASRSPGLARKIVRSRYGASWLPVSGDGSIPAIPSPIMCVTLTDRSAISPHASML